MRLEEPHGTGGFDLAYRMQDHRGHAALVVLIGTIDVEEFEAGPVGRGGAGRRAYGWCSLLVSRSVSPPWPPRKGGGLFAALLPGSRGQGVWLVVFQYPYVKILLALAVGIEGL